MEYLAYASMVIANEGENIEYHLPQLEFNWKKNFKSAWLNFASIGALVTILVQAQAASAAYYVNTNGSCLKVRTGPGFGYPIVTCVSNGTLLKPVVKYYNGFAELSSGNWVSAQWVNTTPGSGYSPGLGVGGQYPEYFHRPAYYSSNYYSYHRHHLRYAYYHRHHRHHFRHVYAYNYPGRSNNYNYPDYGSNNYGSNYGSNSYNYPDYGSNNYNYNYGSNSYNYPDYGSNNYGSNYGSNSYNYPDYGSNNYNYNYGGNSYDYPRYGGSS